MDKDEILSKSRKEKKDEGAEYAHSHGRKLGAAALLVMFVIISVINLYHDIDNSSILALFWAYLSFETYGRYQFKRNTSMLLATGAGIILSIIFLAKHIMILAG